MGYYDASLDIQRRPPNFFSFADSSYVVSITTRGDYIDAWPVVTFTGAGRDELVVGPIHYTRQEYEMSRAIGNSDVHTLSPYTVNQTSLGELKQVTVTLLDDVTKGYAYWFVNTITVNETTSQTTHEFVCWCWVWRDSPNRAPQILTLVRRYNYTEVARERVNPRYPEL